jgi:hypothetical protein
VLEMPPDPFDGTPDLSHSDLTVWGRSCRMLYNALVEAGFNETQALDFVAKMMIGVMKK